jgi:hypothetical protein
LLICDRATPEQIEQMLQEHKFYIKLAVDIERRVIVGGGDMHVDYQISDNFCRLMVMIHTEANRHHNV